MKWILSTFISLAITFMSFGQKSEKASIVVLSINLNTLTTIGVPCEEFTSTFGDHIKQKVISTEDSISILESFIQKVKIKKNDKDSYIDTRAKIIYHSKKGKNYIICVNNFNYIINSNPVKKDKLFFNFILSLIPEEDKKSTSQTGAGMRSG